MKPFCLHFITALFSVCILAIVTNGCNNKTNDVNTPVPVLSCLSAEIRIGETIEVQVHNASHIHGISAPEIVSVEISGNSILITGNEKGICDVRLTADNTPLSCRIKVTDHKETPEKPDDNLKDKTTRADGNGISIRYNIPGIIVKLSGDTITFRNLSSGEYVISTTNSLNINGDIVSTQTRELIKSDDDTKWYRHRMTDNDYVWIVISDI